MGSLISSPHKNRYLLIVAEALIATALLAFVGWWIYDHAGGPLLLDELTYMEVAILRTREVALINRYFPVYLMMPFIWLTGNPFQAVKVFWTILAILTAIFTYLSSRVLSKAIIPAIAAVILYFAQVGIFHYPGVVWPDFTVMLLFSCIIWLYLLLPYLKKQQSLVIGIIGTLVYFAVRSKETAGVLVFLFFGYGFLDGDGFRWRRFTKSLSWSIAGIFAGIIFIFMLDMLVLGDAFWTIRGVPETMRLSMVEYIERVDFNYLLLLADGLDTFTLLIFFVISGMVFFNRLTAYMRVFFLFPLIYILTMTLALLRGPGVIEARYLVPIIPVMCALATPILQNENRESTRKKIIAAICFPIGLLIIYQSAFWMIKLLRHIGIDKWDMNNYFMSILFPTALCTLLIIWFGKRKTNLITLILSLLCFMVMVYHPLVYNYSLMETRWAARESKYRFYPFRAFKEELSYSQKMHVFVSSNLPGGNPQNQEAGMLATRDDVIATMYNVYFQKNASAGQFVIGNLDQYLKNMEQFSHALITSEEWSALPVATQEMVPQEYNLFWDVNDELVLIKRKS